MGPRVFALVVALSAFVATAGPIEDAVEPVLATFRAGGDLRELAARDDPDPWLIADELCARGEHDAADAFARAAPRPDVERLPDYVASRRGKAVDPEARTALAVAHDALATRNFEDVLKKIDGGSPAKEDDIAAVRLAYGRAMALRGLSRLEESANGFLAAASRALDLGWRARAASALEEAGRSAWLRSDLGVALAAWQDCLHIQEARGNRIGFAKALGYIGITYDSLGEYTKALECQERALHLKRELADRAGIAETLGNIGVVHCNLGDYAKAIDFQERALTLMEELGDRGGIARNLRNLGVAHDLLGDYPKAIELQERALTLEEETGNRRGVGKALGNLGVLYDQLGEYPKALDYLERSYRVKEEVGDRRGAAGTLANMGGTHWSLGDYPAALDTYARALAMMGETGDRSGAAATLGNVGNVHHSLGDHAKALEFHERDLRAKQELGDRVGAAATLGNIGNVHYARGDYAKALEFHERSLKIEEELGLPGAAATLSNMGLVHGSRGDYSRALDCQVRALGLMETLGNRAGAAAVLGIIGSTHSSLGDHAKALDCQDRALAEAERLGARETVARTLRELAHTHLARGDARSAAACGRRAIDVLGELASGLAEEEGARAREQFADVFDTGARAARSMGDTESVSYFLESGRAMTLLESLGGRRPLSASVVPQDLRDAEAKARVAESVARTLYRRALDRGGDVDALWKEVERTQVWVVDATRRIQREAKEQAAVLYPEAAPLDRIRAALREGEGLVTYALMADDALALVVTRDLARMVPLGKTEPISKAAAALQAAVLRPDERGVAVPPHERLDFVAKRLRALVVEPLGLKDTKRLLVAPHAELAYVPFALLAPEVEIVYVPSGTTYGVLLDDAALRGDGVLALGDPPAGDAQAATVYRGGEELAPLPASRAEAQAIGDVALVGKDATESGFVKAVASRPRWRAVHFACHGLVRADLPELSCLALGADAENDGFLTVLEIFRLKVPADLVVLSACETAKGKVYRAEGVIGLARAFMLAGSPRVICSLWKVDDAATRDLMTTFYKEWKSGVGAAEALRKAQQHVASQEKWKDPYFWAAWQLWGLPQ